MIIEILREGERKSESNDIRSTFGKGREYMPAVNDVKCVITFRSSRASSGNMHSHKVIGTCVPPQVLAIPFPYILPEIANFINFAE